MSSATGSGATVFGVDYFGRPAYLAESPQFYKQTMVGVFERVYETGPVPSRTACLRTAGSRSASSAGRVG